MRPGRQQTGRQQTGRQQTGRQWTGRQWTGRQWTRGGRRNGPWAAVVASALGLLAIGALAVGRAIQAARSEARDAASRAARASADELRTLLADPRRLVERAAGAVAFEVRDSGLLVPPELWPLDPAGDAGLELPMAVRALATAAATQRDAERLAGLLPALDPVAASWLRLWLGWRQLRDGDLAGARRWLAAVDAAPPMEPGPRGLADSACLLAVALGDEPPDWTVELLARAESAVVEGVAARLADRGRADLTASLRASHTDVVRRRAALRAVRATLPQLLGGSGSDGPLVAAGHVVAWRSTGPGAATGIAAADPLAVARAVAPAPQPGLAASRPGADAVAVLPGAVWLGIVVPDASPGRTALLGLALLLAACGVALALALRATARAVDRESLAVRSRADFLQSVTHELKTPLAAIRLLAERLAEGRVRGAERLREHHMLLAGEAARLAVLVENVLDLGRTERGERAYDRRVETLDAVAGEAAALFAPLAEAAGQRINVALGAAGARGKVDRGALVQALVNVLENARKYAPGGAVELRTARAGAGWTLTVRDHGPGVPAAERDAIFGRFARGVAQRDGAVPGVGLGLHLARSILRAHGGELCCTAPDDGGPGAAFVFTLPLTELAGEVR
ncbi:MAG: HAMP domain-containing histidine kinase [Planctomycetes bacterium]|nr:HAMP domain-containing histidine kinase [Planctomycetota bacterium]